MVDEISFVKLANLPTPLEEIPRLAHKIGLSKLFIKRDDLTGLAGGGNKARKLEYIFGEIIKSDYDVVITAGGSQSNHARMTAAAARKMGLDIKLVLGGSDFISFKGNLLLDILYGAEIRYIIDDDRNDRLSYEMQKWADELRCKGKNPFIIPIGGSGGLGALGYVKAMKELSVQFGNGKVQIILGVGSCGTFAGAILGAKIFMPNASIVGISISRKNEEIKNITLGIIKESAELIEYNVDTQNVLISCFDNYFSEYGSLTQDGQQAIYDCAALEGILLDPIYTGKVMAGLIDLTAKKIIEKELPVIFLHSGGLPILFSYENELVKSANCTKIKDS